MRQHEAYEWLKGAMVGQRTPEDLRLEYVAALAVKDLIWRHEKLCEAVMGILTEGRPEGMSDEHYRQLLREQVAMAMNGLDV